MAATKQASNGVVDEQPAPVEPPEAVPVHVALARAAADIGAVAKNLRNAEAGYAARSIDDVLDAVHDPLTRHGIVLMPEVIEANYAVVATGRNQTPMREATLKVRWRFIGPQGDYLDAVTCGEALDSGDKATNKAQSAALKYALLHAFTIPINSGDRESDESSPERAPQGPEIELVTVEQLNTITQLAKALKDAGGDPGRWPVVLGVRLLHNRKPVATFEMAEALIDDLTEQVKRAAPTGDGETHCQRCGAVAGAPEALAFDDNGDVTLCTSCPQAARDEHQASTPEPQS